MVMTGAASGSALCDDRRISVRAFHRPSRAVATWIAPCQSGQVRSKTGVAAPLGRRVNDGVSSRRHLPPLVTACRVSGVPSVLDWYSLLRPLASRSDHTAHHL